MDWKIPNSNRNKLKSSVPQGLIDELAEIFAEEYDIIENHIKT